MLEVPSNMALKLTSPSKWLGSIVLVWGALCACMAACSNATSVLVIRFLLGCAEAGFVPGVIYYLTLWYNPQAMGIRLGVFYLAPPAAGALGGLIAYGVSYMDGVRNLSAWRWLFLLEGIPTVLLAVVMICFLPDRPDSPQTTWLTETERELYMQDIRGQLGEMVRVPAPASNDSTELTRPIITPAAAPPGIQNELTMLQSDLNSASSSNHGSIQSFDRHPAPPSVAKRRSGTRHNFHLALTNPCTYLHGLLVFTVSMSIYSVSFLMSTIIRDLGFDNLEAQLLTIPPYAFAGIFLTINSYASDRTHRHGFHIGLAATVGMVGFILLAVLTSKGGEYAVLFLATLGPSAIIPINFTWLAVNIRHDGERSIATAMASSIGGFGGVVAGQMYRSSEAPRYIASHLGNAIILAIALITALVLDLMMRRRRHRSEAKAVAYESDTVGSSTQPSSESQQPKKHTGRPTVESGMDF
ncbi:hypothetical protein IWQ60_002633 [Tieghemiomyces parasiticus]|uniref:Major facilitator superfamily (MFS) profile domain-containing protein n=1 Tax=Tieghemiomyces parasiticus TaxID=78921 RepID=A0A9W8ACB5_9FUNG|nr:hypothetical protein IWQ60_002633 [Tieghemiomyces parasiticus]